MSIVFAKKSKLLSLALVLVFLFTAVFCVGGVSAKTDEEKVSGGGNTKVHVHINDGIDNVLSVQIVQTGIASPISLTRNGGSTTYTVSDGNEYVKDDITKIIVTTSYGVQEFSPASKFGGVEGGGSINYWISVAPEVLPPSPPSTTSAALTLTKSADSTWYYPGDKVTYTFTLTNYGNLPVTGIVLTDAMLTGKLSGAPTTLGVGLTTSFSVETTAPTGASYPFNVVNNASVYGSYDADTSESGTDIKQTTPAAATYTYAVLEKPAPSIKITKTIELGTDEIISFNDTIKFKFVVENTGNVDFDTVDIIDEKLIPGGKHILYTFSDGLKAKQSVTYYYDYVVKNAGYQDNYAVAEGNFGNSSVTDDSTVYYYVYPIIELTKTVNHNNVKLGTEVTYTFTVTNPTDIDLFGVEVEDPLLDQNAPIYVYTENEGILEAGDHFSFTRTYSNNADLEVINEATVIGYYYGESQAMAASLSDSTSDDSNSGYYPYVTAEASAIYTQYVQNTGGYTPTTPETPVTTVSTVPAPIEDETEPVPAAPKAPSPVVQELPHGDPVEDVNEVVPAAPVSLPKTGGIPAAAFGGLGGLLATAGLFLRRKLK